MSGKRPKIRSLARSKRTSGRCNHTSRSGEERRAMGNNSNEQTATSSDVNIRDLVKGVIQEFVEMQQTKTEPAYKTELLDERKRREQLEQRVNQLMEENRRTRQVAEELDRGTTIRTELQKLGVAKVDLA